MTSFILSGIVANLRKLDTRGKYESVAFDLEIEDVQTWHCAAFGRVANQALRLNDGAWTQVHGEIAELSLDGKRLTGLKISEALAAKAPGRLHRSGRVAQMERGLDGRRGWLEVLDDDGVSWALEAASGRLEDAARNLEIGADVDVDFCTLPVLVRFQDGFRPVLSSILESVKIRTANTQATLLEAVQRDLFAAA